MFNYFSLSFFLNPYWFLPGTLFYLTGRLTGILFVQSFFSKNLFFKHIYFQLQIVLFCFICVSYNITFTSWLHKYGKYNIGDFIISNSTLSHKRFVYIFSQLYGIFLVIEIRNSFLFYFPKIEKNIMNQCFNLILLINLSTHTHLNFIFVYTFWISYS